MKHPQIAALWDRVSAGTPAIVTMRQTKLVMDKRAAKAADAFNEQRQKELNK